jgi:RND family efflux transporter MFP subunit
VTRCLASALLLVLSACGKPEARKAIQTLPLVRAHTAVASPAMALALRGTVAAAHRVRLGFKLGGVIAALAVEEGQHVKRGQVVGRLDDLTARAAVRAAQAARDKAKRDALRAERLAGEGALPTSLRDDARTGLEAAEATLATAREALQRMQLVSPAAGTVFARLAEPGETVGPGMPVLVIDSTERLTIRAGATESELARLAPGLAATLVLADGASLDGRIKRLARTPNIEDGLFTVTVTPDDADQPKLLTGALVRVLVATTTERRVIRVPIDSVVHRRDRNYVFVLEPATSGPRARLRPVVVGRISGIEVVVTEGLDGGERIVAEGAYFLQDGQAVRILE